MSDRRDTVQAADDALARTGQPFDLPTARRFAAGLTRDRRWAQGRLRAAVEKKAETEREYRKALAVAIVQARAEHPATVAGDIARGRPDIAQLKAERDVADGMVDVWQEEVRLHDQRRATFHRDVEWSMKVAPDGQYEPRDVGPVFDPQTGEVR